MAFENAKRILKDSSARVAQSAEGIYDENLVILFWQDIEAKHINECIAYLNHADRQVVGSPSVFFDISFEQDLYHLHAYYSERDQRLYRLLMREPIVTDGFGEEDTKWKLLSGETYPTGMSTIVLGMNNVDPAYANEFQLRGMDKSYTDQVYLLGGEVLEGEWYHFKRETEESPKTGLHTVRWYLTRYLSNEVGFLYYDQFGSVTTEINLVDANGAIISDFMAHTYYDASGNWYYSSNGTSYTRMNGEAATGSLDGLGALRLSDERSGRAVSTRNFFDEREKNWNLLILVKHSAGKSLPEDAEDGDFIVQYGMPEEKVRFIRSYEGVELPTNLDLSGRYVSIDLEGNTVPDGTEGALTGRRSIRTRVENARVVDGKFRYDLYEVEETAPMDVTESEEELIDQWMAAGHASKYEFVDNRLSVYRADDTPGVRRLYMVAAPRKRLLEITRERKYFVRSPTVEDIVSAGAVEGTGTTAIDRLQDVGQLRGGLWYIERTTVQRNDWSEWTVAEGAFNITWAAQTYKAI